MPDIRRKFGDIEKAVIMQVIDSEYKTARANQETEISDYESYIDLLDAIRSEKDYDWMSNISIPEFASQMLTQSSIDAQQYFQTRDFVEAYLEDASDQALAAADSAKECINRTLNQRHLNYFQKYIRGKTIANISGSTYKYCWWERRYKKKVVGKKPIMQEQVVGIDGMGQQMMGQVQVGEENIVEDVLVVDRFNCDILDRRNVFTDNKYVYSLQEKDWVMIRFEKTYHQLVEDQEMEGYFNLDFLKEKIYGCQPLETETSRETVNKYDNKAKENRPVNRPFDIIRRFGKYWCKVTKRDPDTEEPLEVEPGIDHKGEPMEKAELLEVVQSFALDGGDKVMIQFHLQPYRDAEGNPYRNIIRGLCYVHPAQDGGAGDGKYCRELQIGINDTFNVSNDRVMLATLPVLKGKKYALEDTDTVRIEPNHVMALDDPNDVQELQIKDDTGGADSRIGLLTQKMNQVTAIFPPQMGGQGAASTTATAIAASGTNSNVRSNYKSLTYENTMLTEFYWMILQMTYQFASEKTGMKLMGDKLYSFDPTKEYFYKPVSASIETEHSKQAKVEQWNRIMQTLVPMVQTNPSVLNIINKILTKISALMGEEAANVVRELINPAMQAPPEAGGPQAQQPTQQAVAPSNNQNGVAMSGQEMATRMTA